MPSASRIVDLVFPAAGENDSAAYQAQAPYTCPGALNVTPRDVFQQRVRGGTRAGLAMYAAKASSNPVRLLESNVVKVTGKAGGYVYQKYEDSFDVSSLGYYSTLTNFTSTLPSVSGGMLYAAPDGGNRSFVLPAQTSDNLARFGIYIVPYQGSHSGGTYRLFCNTTDFDDSLWLDFTIAAGGAWSLQVGARSSGVTTIDDVATGNDGADIEGWLEVLVDYSGRITTSGATIYWRGTAIDQGSFGFADTANPVVALLPDVNGVRMQIQRLRLDHYEIATDDQLRRRVLMSQSGILYHDIFPGMFFSAGTLRTLASDRRLTCATYGENVFIPDNSEPLARGVNGVATATTFASASYPNLGTTFSGKNPQDYVLEIVQAADILTAQNTFTFGSGNPVNLVVSTNNTTVTVSLVSNYTSSASTKDGSISLSTVSGLTFTKGTGTNDHEMSFSGSLSNVNAALQNATLYASAAGRPDSIQITFNHDGGGPAILGLPTGNTYTIQSAWFGGSSAAVVGTYSILAVGTSTFTIAGGPSSTLSNLTFRILRCPKRCNVVNLIKSALNPLKTGSDGIVSGGNAFTNAAGTNFATLLAGREPTDYAIEVYSGSTVSKEYPIVSVSSTTITIANGTNATGLTYRIVYKDKLTEYRATTGTLPVGCTNFAIYRARVVAWGDPLAPNELYMSRQGDPFDWDFSQVDAGAAFKMSAGDAGQISGPIRAFIPYHDAYALICVDGGTYRMTDDPGSGGQALHIDHRVGALSATAWCYGEKSGEVFLLTNDGVYATVVDCPTCDLVRVSRGPLPAELLQIVKRQVQIEMAYDLRNRWVDLWLTPIVATAGVMPQPTHWRYVIDTKGFFRVQYASNNHCPTAALSFLGDSLDDQCTLLGTFGGDVLRYSNTAENDCGQTITNYVLIGPIKLGRTARDAGILSELRGILAADSGSATWELYVGDTAEAAVVAARTGTSPFAGGTFAASTINYDHPRARGAAAVIKVKNLTRSWSIETLPTVCVDTGKQR